MSGIVDTELEESRIAIEETYVVGTYMAILYQDGFAAWIGDVYSVGVPDGHTLVLINVA